MREYKNLEIEIEKMFHLKTNTLGTVPKGLERRPEELEIRRRIETIQTTEFLRSARILRRVMEI